MVTKLLVIRKTLMISAAVVSRCRVLRMRPAGRSSVLAGSPSTSGITATPVSNPDRPERELREDQQGDADHRQRAAVLRPTSAAASRRSPRVR